MKRSIVDVGRNSIDVCPVWKWGVGSLGFLFVADEMFRGGLNTDTLHAGYGSSH